MIHLYNDDCFNVFPKIEDRSVDLVLVDPPYGTTACKWDTVINLDLMWEELKRIVKPNTAIVLFSSEPFSSVLRLSNIHDFKYDWVWSKNTGSGFLNVKNAPLKSHEMINVFSISKHTYNPQFEEYEESTKKRFKEGEKVNNTKQMINSTNQVYGKTKRNDSEQAISFVRGRYPRTVQYFKVPPNCKGRYHPTQKPVALMEYLIKTYSNEGDTVLDFCMGSGTTGVAAKNLNRKFIGVEKEESYFNIAKERISNA